MILADPHSCNVWIAWRVCLLCQNQPVLIPQIDALSRPAKRSIVYIYLGWTMMTGGRVLSFLERTELYTEFRWVLAGGRLTESFTFSGGVYRRQDETRRVETEKAEPA